ncbi:MAG: hypothetical protein E4H32_10955 [Nitrospirales bacterium]|nr:MAG: hypothetical protein E4H32_10955 [Nitrospirales bacterium]
MAKIRKIPNQEEMIGLLRSGKVALPPLFFRVLKDGPEMTNIGFDALVEASWRGSKARFVVECKSLSTPKAFRNGLNLLKTETLPKGCWPLLFLPFLGEQQLQELEQEQITSMPGRMKNSGGPLRFRFIWNLWPATSGTRKPLNK